MYQLRILAMSVVLLVLSACGGGSSIKVGQPVNAPNAALLAMDPQGEELGAAAALLEEENGRLLLYAADPRAVLFKLSYDPAAMQVVTVSQGSWFGPGDLFLSISDRPGLVAIGGYHLTQPDAAVPQLVAIVEFASGQAGRRVSALPTGNNAKPGGFGITDNGDGSITLGWTYQSSGDCNQDGEVGISDVTPIGVHFGKESGDLDWLGARLADPSGDGEVGINDLTPIGANYGVRITGYKVEQSTDQNGAFSEVASVLFSGGNTEPWLTFAHTIAVPVDGNWYRIRAYHADDESQGAACAPLELSLLPPGINPTAVANADVTAGTVPLTVNLRATGSTDSDGNIVGYYWDVDGDGVYETDATATNGIHQHTYSAKGTYIAALRVVDNSGRSGTDTVVISVSGGGSTGDAPEAHAYCMPNNGWADLTVYFSPFGSTDDGVITRYEWDLDGNGTFETDATSTAGYTEKTYGAGEHTATLKVTDNEGNSTTVSTAISVRDPALSSVDYGYVFDDSQVRPVLIDIDQADWDAMWVTPEDELEVTADATVFGETIEDIGFSMRGHRSLWDVPEKKPWRIDTNEYVDGQEYRNLKQLLFNNFYQDPSMVREKLGYDMLAFAGVTASQVCYVDFWIDVHGNGLPAEFWGVYSMVERVDKKFIANRFGEDYKDGNLYKAAAWIEGSADLEYYGPDISAYPTPHGEICYKKETNESEGDYSDVINLCKVVSGVEYATPDAFASALEQVFNVDGFLRYMACCLSCSNLDIYMYTGNNYYLYNNPRTGRFEWIPWDVNDSWGLFMEKEINRSQPLYDWGGMPLTRRVIEVPRYRWAYAAYVDLLRRHHFTYSNIRSSGQAWHDLINPQVRQDTGDKMFFGDSALFPIAAFDTNWDTDFIQAPELDVFGVAALTQVRCDYIDAHLLADL